MAIYLSTLLLIVLAALGLLAAVALAAIGEEHGDGTRLTGRLRIMMKHLNGDAAPKQVAQFFASATRTHERADAERSGSASDTVAPRPATADATTAEQHTARHRVRGDGLAA